MDHVHSFVTVKIILMVMMILIVMKILLILIVMKMMLYMLIVMMLTHLLNPSDHSLATAADVVVGLTFYESYGDADIFDIFEIS